MKFTKKKMKYSSLCIVLAIIFIASAPSTPSNTLFVSSVKSSTYDFELNEISNYSLSSSFD